MRTIYKYTLVSLTAAALIFPGCGKDYFDELSQNPNQVSVPTLTALLATSTHKAGINNYTVAANTAPYVQYTANPTAAAASDIYETIDFTGMWDALYFAMADVNEMKKLAIEQNNSEYLGVANVLMAYNLGMVNSMWGSAPFSEAFNPSNFTPKYDSDQEVFNATLALIDQGITELAKTDATLKLAATSDVIYKGDRAKWLKFAHALRARLLIKTSKTPTYSAAAVLTSIDNSFTSNADDAGMASFVLRNNWATVSRNNTLRTLGGWLSEQFIDHLNGTTYGLFDPRIRKLTDPAVSPGNSSYPQYIGTVNGAGNRNNPPHNNTVWDENYITITSPWTSDNAPILLATYAELKFIEAEAALATNRQRAYTAYLAGIRANMEKLQVPTSEQNAYINDPRVSVGQNALTVDLIMKEKYVATFLNPEAWNDARRYDYKYKDFGMPLNAVLPTFIRRLDYPIGERSKNGENVPVAEPRSNRLWWDK